MKYLLVFLELTVIFVVPVIHIFTVLFNLIDAVIKEKNEEEKRKYEEE